MSTRSLIGLLNDDKSVTYIYCHFDGYLDGVGATLEEHYTDYKKIKALLGLGNLSSLGSKLGQQHPFDYSERETASQADPDQRNWCVAYGRDRGETEQEANTVATVDLYKADFKESWAEYAYLFDEGVWYVFWDGSGFFDMTPERRPDDFITIRAAVKAQEEEEDTDEGNNDV